MRETLYKIKSRNIDKLFPILQVLNMHFLNYNTDFFVERGDTTYFLFECSSYEENSYSKNLSIFIESIEEITVLKYNKFIHDRIVEYVSEKFTIVDINVYDGRISDENLISQYE